MRMTKEEKRIDAAVDAAYKLHGNNVQINIFDIGKITAAGTAAGKAGQDIGEAVKTALAKYRQN